MLLKNTFLFKEIGEEGMLIPIVGGNVDASKIFNLNETGTYIMKKLLDDYEIDEIIDSMIDEYQIDRKTLEEDLNAFIEELKKRGLYE
ncbi:MAG: PqqD family protein [Anaeroplasma sp.]|uniref:PqqD family protein n=1 Tax=Anaeroplasma sp. TaxID=1872523 RepID=UPI002A910DCF|nr:PqqD family protein [Anaeroplasma sp.]MDY5983217.1 PqqD family protein [Anaeroplasma sp.]